MLVWSFAALRSTTPFPGTAALVPVAATSAILGAGTVRPDHEIARALGRRAPREVGRISYPLYLWHWPVLTLVPAFVGHALGNFEVAALVAVSVVLAEATTRLIEEPLRFAPAQRVAPRAWLTAAAAMSVFVIGCALLTDASLPSLASRAVAAPVVLPDSGAATPSADVARRATPSALDAVERAVASGASTRAVPANLTPSLSAAYASKAAPFLDGCDNAFTDAVVHHCVYGDATSRTTVVLFGDSHAAQWWPALDLLANRRHWRLVDLSKATCPPISLPVYSPVLGHEFRECEQWRDAAVARIAVERPAVVIVASARHYGPEYHFRVFSPRWNDALASMVRRITPLAGHVIALGPTPHPIGDVPDCLAAHVHAVASCTWGPERALDLPGVAAERAALDRTTARYVDETPWFCTTTSCPVIVGNVLVYRDDNHVTVEYARWLAPVFDALLRPLVATPVVR